MNWDLALIALLHAAFLLAELFPWRIPLLLRVVGGKRNLLQKAGDKEPYNKEAFTPKQLDLVVAIVHNAGIYNGIVAGGLAWAALPGHYSADLAHVMLIGAVVAGVFGAVTLKSFVPAIQAVAGIIGLIRLP